MKIGCHLSMAKGFTHMVRTTIEMKANTFQFFSRNPRGSSVKAFDTKDMELFQKLRKQYQIGPIMAHAPYTMNLAGEKEEVYDFARQVLKEDLERMNSIGIEYFNFHPGSHVGQGIEKGTEKIARAINEAIQGEEKTTLLLETMSGKGSEIGHCFEQLHDIIEKIEQNEKIGVCMDLCHVFASGYDIVHQLEQVLKEFDQKIGLARLKAIHLNDSVMPFASHQDRHAMIGKGEIGWEGILNIMKHPLLRELPYYLETPLETEGHAFEIAEIKQRLEKRQNV